MDNAVSNEIALYSDAVESNTGQVDPYNTTTQSNSILATVTQSAVGEVQDVILDPAG
jgi:hypothetical protein